MRSVRSIPTHVVQNQHTERAVALVLPTARMVAQKPCRMPMTLQSETCQPWQRRQSAALIWHKAARQ